MHSQEVIAELKKNNEAYEEIRERMEAEYWGKTILFHDGEMVAVYNDEGDAYQIGCEKYTLGHFSLHRVGQQPLELGIHSLLLN